MKSATRRVTLFVFAALALAAPLRQTAAQLRFTPDEMKQARRNPRFFTIDPASVTVEKMNPPLPTPAPNPNTPAPAPLPGSPDDPIVFIDRIINLGLKIWGIIERNRPVVDVTNQYATAVPEGITNPFQLGNWNQPHGEIYEMTAKNVYGMRVVKVRYQVLRTDGGSYRGQGKYLANVSVQPLLVEVLWGYRFNLNAEVLTVTNAGTAENPLAAMTLVLKWRIATPIKDGQGAMVYYVRGDGLMREIGMPYENLVASTE
ncbi:MAG: hypothetical protein HYT79_04035 [Elusimicrobia bacterium]|nr:hypothetical protein [Elusimicrobiota bacterium]